MTATTIDPDRTTQDLSDRAMRVAKELRRAMRSDDVETMRAAMNEAHSLLPQLAGYMESMSIISQIYGRDS